MRDNISDLLTRIRNGQRAKLYEIVLFWPTPKVCLNILDLLKNEGFIRGYKKTLRNNKQIVTVLLKYTYLNEPLIKKPKKKSGSFFISNAYKYYWELVSSCSRLRVLWNTFWSFVLLVSWLIGTVAVATKLNWLS